LISLPDADALLRRQMKLVTGLGKRRRPTGDHDYGNQSKAMILRKIFRSRRASGEPDFCRRHRLAARTVQANSVLLTY
jgi:hypothetical protein